jgi:hypothetical protein
MAAPCATGLRRTAWKRTKSPAAPRWCRWRRAARVCRWQPPPPRLRSSRCWMQRFGAGMGTEPPTAASYAQRFVQGDGGRQHAARLRARGNHMPLRSRPHMPDPTPRRGPGVIYRPLPDGSRSTIHPWIRTRPPRGAVQVSTARFPTSRRVLAFQVEGSVVSCLHRIDAVDAGGARLSIDGRLAALASGRAHWWTRIRPPGRGGALQEWRRGPQEGGNTAHTAALSSTEEDTASRRRAAAGAW